jgi:acyl-CoA dehydrogenase
MKDNSDSVDSALQQYLVEIDNFIANEIAPLQRSDDNDRFFDHRREAERTNWNSTPHSGLPSEDWENLLIEARRRADKAGFYRFSLPAKYGGNDGSNLWMAVIREHLAARGLGLFNDLQNEHSIVGNFPDIIMLDIFGTQAQKDEFIWGRLNGTRGTTFGLTEPGHGSDATHMSTRAVRETRDGVEGWRLDGAKAWQTGMHKATHCIVFARTSGKVGDAKGITAFIVPARADGVKIESFEWYVQLLALFETNENH